MALLEQRIKKLTKDWMDSSDYFIVDIQAENPSSIKIFIDGMSGFSIDKCAKLSRLIENTLEEEGLVPEKYVIEVSSPGLSAAFKVPEQYEKNIGKDIAIVNVEGEKINAKLLSFDGKVLEVQPFKIKKKKREEKEVINLKLEEIKQTKEYLKF